MTKRKSEAAAKFEKPAHWTNEAPPKPAPPDESNEPQEKSPTRYGDWVDKGIAWDF